MWKWKVGLLGLLFSWVVVNEQEEESAGSYCDSQSELFSAQLEIL